MKNSELEEKIIKLKTTAKNIMKEEYIPSITKYEQIGKIKAYKEILKIITKYKWQKH